jgi:hypothetical protein
MGFRYFGTPNDRGGMLVNHPVPYPAGSVVTCIATAQEFTAQMHSEIIDRRGVDLGRTRHNHPYSSEIGYALSVTSRCQYLPSYWL